MRHMWINHQNLVLFSFLFIKLHLLWFENQLTNTDNYTKDHWMLTFSNPPSIKYKNSTDNVKMSWVGTLESGIDVGQGINVGPGIPCKKNKCRVLNKYRA